jgi:hypothetical protein
MGLNGLIVMDTGGVPIYCNVRHTKLAVDPALITGFLSAVQAFSKQLVSDAGAGITEMSLHDMKILYRNLVNYNFICLIDPSDAARSIETVMEYLVCMFLARFREHLVDNCMLHDLAAFSSFDPVFEKWRGAKEKDLQKIVEKANPTLLQGMLNRLANYFPSPDLVKINPRALKPIGKKLVWLDSSVTKIEEDKIFLELKRKTEILYGPGMFESIEKDVLKCMQTDILLKP